MTAPTSSYSIEPEVRQLEEASPLQVWILSYNFSPVWAGPSVRFLRYAPGLRQRGVSLRFVTVMRPGCKRTDTQDGTPVERIGPNGRTQGAGLFLIRAVTRALRPASAPDVLVFVTIHPWLYPWLLLARLVRLPTVYIHTMAPEPRPGRSAASRWVAARLRGIYHRAFERVVCSTRALAGFLEEVGVPPERLTTIPNGVALERFLPPADAEEVHRLRTQLELPLDEPVALFVGLRVERKGIIPLVEGWRLHRSRGGSGRLVLVGDEMRDDPSFASFYERWDTILRALPPDHGIEIRPAHAHIEEYFRAADLFVFLSDLEGMPNVIPESMACGIPVLTNAFRGFSPEFGRDGRELVVTTREPERLAKDIGNLMGNPEMRRQLGEAGRRWVVENQGLEQVLDRYAALLREVTEGEMVGGKG